MATDAESYLLMMQRSQGQMHLIDEAMIEMLINDIHRLHTSTNGNKQAAINAEQQIVDAKVKVDEHDTRLKYAIDQHDKDLKRNVEDALVQVGQAVDQANRAHARTETYMTELSKEVSKVSEAKVAAPVTQFGQSNEDIRAQSAQLASSVDTMKTAQDGQTATIQSWTADMTGYVADVNRDKKDMYTTIENLKIAVAAAGTTGPGGPGRLGKRGIFESKVWSGLRVLDLDK